MQKREEKRGEKGEKKNPFIVGYLTSVLSNSLFTFSPFYFSLLLFPSSFFPPFFPYFPSPLQFHLLPRPFPCRFSCPFLSSLSPSFPSSSSSSIFPSYASCFSGLSLHTRGCVLDQHLRARELGVVRGCAVREGKRKRRDRER